MAAGPHCRMKHGIALYSRMKNTPGFAMLRTLLLTSLIALSLAACGNKGPLVLPDQATQKDKEKDKDKDKEKPASTRPAATGSATPASSDAANKH